MKTNNIKSETELTNMIVEGANCGVSLSNHDKAYMEKFCNLEIFIFNETGLRSAKNLPNLPKLMRIELCYNKIDGGLESFSQYPLLRILKLRYNSIKDFNTILPLQKCRQLHHLELFMNPISEIKGYRRQVFTILE